MGASGAWIWEIALLQRFRDPVSFFEDKRRFLVKISSSGENDVAVRISSKTVPVA